MAVRVDVSHAGPRLELNVKIEFLEYFEPAHYSRFNSLVKVYLVIKVFIIVRTNI